MRLVPVYADGTVGEPGQSGVPPGAVSVTPSRQQVVGIATGVVEKWSGPGLVRTVGRVVPDERRVYRITAATDGWIEEAYSDTIGSVVRRDQALAAFYARESLGAQQSYFYALDARDRFMQQNAGQSQMQATNVQVQTATDTLRALGMSQTQIEELAKTRQRTNTVMLRSPADAFVLERNISVGQRFESGDLLYVLADLAKVWVLADLFESDHELYRAGKPAAVIYRGARIPALMSQVLPSFDPGARTLKARLELDNPGYRLRPEMFVDVEFESELPEALVVPHDAVLDTGLRKIVFVDRGQGYFEPRRVTTGWRRDGRVQVVDGLSEGDRIVVSGAFLLDSESRMKAAAVGARREEAEHDVVCDMDVDPVKARSAGRVSTQAGHTYYFCSDGCKKAFDARPAAYAAK
jgi:RND family efflux transporter MFP subunit